MIKYALAASMLLASQATAASKEHADCIAMVSDAYEGVVLIAGNPDARISLLESAAEAGLLPQDQKVANDASLEATLTAAMAYINVLSETCEALR